MSRPLSGVLYELQTEVLVEGESEGALPFWHPWL